MNPKNTFLLLLLGGGLFCFIFFYERHIHPPLPTVKRVLPDFNPAEISVVEVLPAGVEEIRAERTNGNWQLTRPLNYPAQSALVEKLLHDAAELSPRIHISVETLKGHKNMNEEYGFDSPQATLVFQQNGEKRQLLLGSLTAPGDEIYAQVVGSQGVDVIDADFFKKLVPHRAADWRDNTFIKFKEQNYDRFMTYAGGALVFDLLRQGANASWHMHKPIEARVDNPKLNGLLQKLGRIPVTHFVTDDDHPDLESYGLLPAALELRFGHGTNTLLSLQFGKSPTNDDSQVYARHSGQNTVMLVPRAAISPWLAGFQDFRDKHLVHFANGLPETVEVSGTEKFSLRQVSSNEWRMVQPQEFPVDATILSNFFYDVSNMEVARFVNDAALPDPDFITYGLTNPPSRQYLFKRGADTSATNRVIAELDFGAVKDGKIFVRRGDLPDETSVYAITADDYKKLPATSLQLRERRIWEFTENNVAQLRISQNGREQQLVHLGTNRWNIAAGSQGVINELEVEVGAQELGLLEAGKWVQRGDADRARFGFTDKSLKMQVDVRSGDTTRTLTLYFGGIAPDGLRYGDVKMADDLNWIFEFSPVTLDRIIAYFNIQESAP